MLHERIYTCQLCFWPIKSERAMTMTATSALLCPQCHARCWASGRPSSGSFPATQRYVCQYLASSDCLLLEILVLSRVPSDWVVALCFLCP